MSAMRVVTAAFQSHVESPVRAEQAPFSKWKATTSLL